MQRAKIIGGGGWAPPSQHEILTRAAQPPRAPPPLHHWTLSVFERTLGTRLKQTLTVLLMLVMLNLYLYFSGSCIPTNKSLLLLALLLLLLLVQTIQDYSILKIVMFDWLNHFSLLFKNSTCYICKQIRKASILKFLIIFLVLWNT
jgi:hypothetical protein